VAEAQFEFGNAENKHFSALAKYSVLSALALVVYAVANASFLLNVALSGKILLVVRTLDDVFVTLAALFASYQLNQAAKSFRRIVGTQGHDLDLLNLSNKRLRLAFEVQCGCHHRNDVLSVDPRFVFVECSYFYQTF
jgi:hypothetical protein